MGKHCLCKIAVILLIIGGLNWGLVGLFHYDLVAVIFGAGTIVTRAIYDIIGVAALLKLVCMIKKCCCNGSCSCGCDTKK